MKEDGFWNTKLLQQEQYLENINVIKRCKMKIKINLTFQLEKIQYFGAVFQTLHFYENLRTHTAVSHVFFSCA